MKSFLTHFRASANLFLSEYEPLALLLAPLLALLVARTLQSFLSVVHERGLKATFLGFLMSLIKLVPGVQNYIDAEKQKVVDTLNSGGKSKREGWRTELPRAGLGVGVIEKLKNEKRNDAVWQGKCSAPLEELNRKGIFL